MIDPIYFCKLCNEAVTASICPIHNIPAEKLEKPAASPSKPVLVRAAARAPEARPSSAAEPTPRFREVAGAPAPKEEAKKAAAEGVGQTTPPPGSQPAAAPTAGRSKWTGEDTLEEAVTARAEIFLIAGVGGVGKTELLGSFRQAAFRDLFKRKDGMAVPSPQREISLYSVSYGRRRIQFADASGEDFRLLDPQFRITRDISETDLSFLRTIAPRLRGLILMVDLERLWTAQQTTGEDAKQVEVLAWILSLLRWLTRDGRYTAKQTRFSDYIDQTVRRMRKRLRVPVQVIFSRADQLGGFTLPSQQPAWLKNQGETVVRKLSPVGENPLLFAHHCLPDLFEAVQTHADYFRFDFAHALATDKGSGAIIDRDPCGVHLALQWLFDPAWRSFPPPIASRRWIAMDRVLRSRRWERLPDPVGVQR